MPRISYSDDFKHEAIRLVTEADHSRKQVARDLGVSLGTLRDWIHKLAPDGPVVSDRLPEAEQLRQLRREVERLRMERDILKKPSASSLRRRPDCDLRLHPTARERVPRGCGLPRARRESERVPGLARTARERAPEGRPSAHGAHCRVARGESADVRCPTHPRRPPRAGPPRRATACGASDASGGAPRRVPSAQGPSRGRTGTGRWPRPRPAPVHRRAPDRVWCADVKQVWTRQGWLFLAAVLDLYSRRIVGHACGTSATTELVDQAFAAAVGRRRPSAGLVHHSDRGAAYVSGPFLASLAAVRAVRSVSRPGTPLDNAVMESFFSTLERELLVRERYVSRAEARSSLFDYYRGVLQRPAEALDAGLPQSSGVRGPLYHQGGVLSTGMCSAHSLGRRGRAPPPHTPSQRCRTTPITSSPPSPSPSAAPCSSPPPSSSLRRRTR